MPKAQIKKAIDKTSEGMTFVKDGIGKVRSKPWAEPVGTALGVTASICKGLGDFVPGLGIIGGSINVASKLLNPAPSLVYFRDQSRLLSTTHDTSIEKLVSLMHQPKSLLPAQWSSTVLGIK